MDKGNSLDRGYDYLHTLTCSESLFTYDIFKEACLSLKGGVAGGPDMTTYEHIKFRGPVLWDILFTLFARMFSPVKVPSQFRVELILRVFKGKWLEAHNKGNCRGIAMFSVICKVFEMVHLNPIRTGGCFPPGSRFLVNNFGSNEGYTVET